MYANKFQTKLALKNGNKNVCKKEDNMKDKAKAHPLSDWDSLTKEEFYRV